MKKRTIIKVVTIIVVVATLFCAVYIMAHRMGLSEELDFGAGAYYYADIPGFDKIVDKASYSTKVPMWIHIVLFLCWGWLMYRLWVWIDGKGRK
ncbi:MAG: hypothetical protein IJ161_04575 [Bacteroidales bacterium]|jgi:hypothetical protein|nr:hypothetical protein [Bacteroidales bacterium]